ncbi:hypothetical protein T484DRAFT_3390323 [Baffinella frigidus]|nr:hypothetical protein T484DRAFT_3390323 [Cryptophyta sp. CCMP2293]
MLQDIFPVIVGDRLDDGGMSDFFADGNSDRGSCGGKFPQMASPATSKAATLFLVKENVSSGGNCSVSETVAQVMKFQSVVLSKSAITEEQRALLFSLSQTLQAAKADLEALKGMQPAPGAEEVQVASKAVVAARSELHGKTLAFRIEKEAHRILKVVDQATGAHDAAQAAGERGACTRLVERVREAVEEHASALHEAPIAPDDFEAHFAIFQQTQEALYSVAAQKVARASLVDEGAGSLTASLKLEGAKLMKQNQARFAEEKGKEQADVAERHRAGPAFASLVDAVLSGSVLGVRFHLIDQKADGGAPDAEGNCPLHLACCGAHTEVVRCLLSRKVDCNALDARGRSGLHLCALSDARGAAHAIVSGGGANKELKDADGRTAASIAVDLGHAEVAAMCHGGVAGPSSQAAQEYQETVEKFLRDTLGDGGSAQAQREVQIWELAQRQETLRTKEESAVKEKRYDDAENLSQQITATSDKILHTQRFAARPSCP